jgi:hypothetical protein
VLLLAIGSQTADIFSPRKALSASAHRSGWQGFIFVLREKKNAFVRLF